MYMKYFFLIIALVGTALTADANELSTTGGSLVRTTYFPATSIVDPRATPTPKPDPAAERSALDAAIALTTTEEKSAALEAFIKNHSASSHIKEANFHLSAALAEVGGSKLSAGDTSAANDYFTRSVNVAPEPVDGKLFDEVFAKFPGALFFSGARNEALELASLLEKKSGGKAARLVALSGFYLSIENGTEAKRLAEAAAAAEPAMPAAYITIGMANRLDFNLEASAAAFAKALELDPSSLIAKRGFAEINRAIGKPAEAEKLYSEILTAFPEDTLSKNGLILAMFENGKRPEAEVAFAKAIEENPNSLTLIAGVAYWYAASGNGEKAVELATKAISIEPRYIWSHIALARGQMLQNKPVEAERTLTAARQYGNFPTLEYEIAITRIKAGFYQEAVEELEKSFAVIDGNVVTKLGGRIERSGKTLDSLVEDERRSSILAAKGSLDGSDSENLLALFKLSELIKSETPDETQINNTVDTFTAGDDAMRLHRQVYVAGMLMDKRVAVERAVEIIRSASGNTDAGLTVANPSAAVMAGELYEPRRSAFINGEFLLVPEVPRNTLSAILRGRIEDLTGYGLLLQGNYDDAAIRLRRAISVLPEKSAWWRTSKWRLGDALVSSGKEQEALDNYIQGYDQTKPEVIKYITIEGLYKKLNGNTDGLEEKIGANPLPPAIKTTASSTAQETPVEEKKTTPEEETKTENTVATEPEKTEPEKTSTEEKKVEPKTEESKTETTTTPEEKKEKSLFDPIVINVADKVKPTETTETKTETKPEVQNTEKTAEPKPEPEKKETDESDLSSAVPPKPTVRPRIVSSETTSESVAVCSVDVSQANISLINNGGSIGMLVGIKGETEDRSLTAVSIDPKDVEVILEREMTGSAGRSFYVIRSISTNVGTYKIEFTNAVCGKKEVTVTVR